MKTKIKNMFARLAAMVTLVLGTASSVYAQQSATPGTLLSPDDCPPGTTCTGDFRTVVISYINYFLSFLGLLAVVMIIYAGVLMVSAQGDDEQTGKGKTIILWAAIGIVIVLLAFTIVNFVIGVQSTTG